MSINITIISETETKETKEIKKIYDVDITNNLNTIIDSIKLKKAKSLEDFLKIKTVLLENQEDFLKIKIKNNWGSFTSLLKEVKHIIEILKEAKKENLKTTIYIIA